MDQTTKSWQEGWPARVTVAPMCGPFGPFQTMINEDRPARAARSRYRLSRRERERERRGSLMSSFILPGLHLNYNSQVRGRQTAGKKRAAAPVCSCRIGRNIKKTMTKCALVLAAPPKSGGRDNTNAPTKPGHASVLTRPLPFGAATM